MIEHTNQMLPNGMTRCWSWDEKKKKYRMWEEQSGEPYRAGAANHCFVPGNPDDNRDARGRPILGKGNVTANTGSMWNRER